ncbi:MAG: ORF6N domain-containing protein [Candidatus Omnitrophota bacterium]
MDRKKPLALSRDFIPIENITNRILFLREMKVMLDRDLAELYRVKSIVLRQQVKRNTERFPEDFMFQLTAVEAQLLVSQNVIPSKKSLGGSLPYAFTEQGVAMLSSVLHSQRAIQVNIQVMRAFTKLRKMLMVHEDLKRKIEDMEKKYDRQFKIVFDAIRRLIEPSPDPKKTIGFRT